MARTGFGGSFRDQHGFHPGILWDSDTLQRLRVVGVVKGSPISRRSASRWCSSPEKQDRWERVGHVLRKAYQLELVSNNLYRNPVAFFVSKLSLRLNLPDNCIHLCWPNLSWQPYQKEVSILFWVL